MTRTMPGSGRHSQSRSGFFRSGSWEKPRGVFVASSPMNQDFLDLLRAFIDRNVRFLIVGAYALAVHGRPRATGDLEVWVYPTPESAAKVVSALEQFGAPLLTEEQ